MAKIFSQFVHLGMLLFILDPSLAQNQFDIYNEVDLTLQPNTKGKDVVTAVNHLISLSGIFVEDDRFLVRTSWVESRFGNNNETYIPPNQGGIWKVSSTYLDATQSTSIYPHLIALHSKILESFSIDWMTVTRPDLEKPLYSGLAFRLYLTTIPASIPTSISEQAQYWRLYYNHNDSLNIATYINAVTSLEETYTCIGKLDLVFVLDGSGSVTGYFPEINSFIASLVAKFSLDFIHIGFLMYDSRASVSTVFELDNNLSLEEMVQIISEISPPNNTDPTSERPDLGIQRATQMLKNSATREGAPKVIATFYDGGGTTALLTNVINEAKANDIVTYSIPVGNETQWDISPYKENILITAGSDPTQILDISSVVDNTSLNQFAYKLNDKICRVSQNRLLNVGDVLLQGETRYYNYDVSNIDDGSLQLFTFVTRGSILGYYSYSVSNPSSALHDGSFNASSSSTESIIIPGVGASIVYIGIRGETSINSYTIVGVVNSIE